MAELLTCCQLIKSSNKHVSRLECEHWMDYTFVQITDTQLGLLERYVEKREPPFSWDLESELVNRACTIINQLSTKPKFVIVCGDLIDAQPNDPERMKACASLVASFSLLCLDVPVLVLPGNHDIGDKPCDSDLVAYRSVWGDDYYSYWCGSCKFIVVNSQLYWNSSNCPSEATAQDEWLQHELAAPENENATQLVIFQHIPFFVKDINEPDDYFNLPKKTRLNLLQRYYDAGVRFVFSGHLHYNSSGVWAPDGSSSSPLHMISSSAVGVQLGADKSGLRIVHVSGIKGIVSHHYYSFEELEQKSSIVANI